MAITEDDRKRMGTVNPLLTQELQRFPALVPRPGDDQRQSRAAHLAKLRYLYPIPGPIPEQVAEAQHSIVARDGHQIPVKIYKPLKQPVSPSPVMVALHEGGWRMGDMTDEDLNCRMASRDLGAVCVNVEYRLAPEHPWPTCVHDCYDVLQWVAKTALPANPVLPADPRQGFIVGGASAGGNLAAVMCQLGRDEALSPPLTGQYLAVPSLLWHDVVPEKWRAEYRSRLEARDDPVLPASRGLSDGLAGRGSADPLFSPLLHRNLRDLPPCYLQVAGLDPLRDEALLYERVLREENGVQTRIDVYDGYGHMFWTNWPLLDRSQEFVEDTLEGLKWLLAAGAAKG